MQLTEAAVISFEDNVPTGWTATNGKLTISQEKAKLGSSSLCWEWNAGSVLTAEESTIKTSSSENNGGITMWIYNTEISNKNLQISFHSSSGKQCSLDFKLNFKGWRCLWARYREDMGLPTAQKGLITTMKIVAPSSGSGKVYLDYLEFVSNVSWEKMSNAQYTVKESTGIEGFYTIYNISAPTSVTPSDAQKQAFNTITQRLDDWYYGSGNNQGNSYYQTRSNNMKSYITRGVSNLPVIASNGTINKSGLFPHDHFHGKTVDGVKLVSSRNIGETYMIQLAYDYKKNKSTASLNKAIELLDWYYDQGWAAGSALGTLRMEMLRSAGYYHAAFMLRDELGAERSKLISEANRWFNLFGMTYEEPKNPGELADYIRSLAVPKLLYVLSLSNEGERTAAMLAYQKYLNNAFKHAHGFLGSMKPDGSGYHHHAPYYSAYYPQVLYVGCFLYYMLSDTPFALSQETFENLKQGLLAFRFFSAGYHVPGSTGGRFPHQTEILQQLIPSYAYLSLASSDKELISAFKRIWQPTHSSVKSYISSVKTDICFTSTYGEIEAVIEAAKLEGVAEENPVGTSYMPFSGLLIARQADWMLTVKGFSKHIWDYESSGTENLYGRYLSYGHIEYTDLENEYRSFGLTKDDTDGKTEWDWNLLPGTTTKYLSKENLSYSASGNKHRNFSDQTFLGGIGLDETTAMFTNRIHDNAIDNSFYADKSVFVFDNIVYCMGSGINDVSTTTPFYTTLFQNKKALGTATITVDGIPVTENMTDLENPVIRDNFNNVYLLHDGFTNINVGSTYVSAVINHGKRIVDKSYRYSWLIKPTDEQVKSYKNNSPIRVVSQGSKGHAVYHREKEILAASVFEAETAVNMYELLRTNLPILYMRKKTDRGFEIAFSNPDMNRSSAANNDALTDAIAQEYGAKSEIVIEMNGIFYKAVGDQSGVVVENTGATTKLIYSQAHDGETYRVILTGPGVTNISQEKTNLFNVTAWIENDICRIQFPESKSHDWHIIDINGRVIKEGKEENNNTQISMYPFPKGVYFLKVNVENKLYSFKLIK